MKALKILILLVLIAIPNISSAAIHYVRDGGTGNGSDWTNAWDTLPANLVRGDTYYIADGIYVGYSFDDAESGSTYIYIKKAIESDHGTSTGWSSTYGDGVALFNSGLFGDGIIRFRTGYYDFDGQVGSGQSGHGFRIEHNGLKGIYEGGESSPVNYIKLRHVEIKGNGPDGNGGGNDNIYIIESTSGYHTGWLIQYCYLWYTGRTNILTRLVNNMTIEYTYFYYNESKAAEHAESISHSYGDNWVLRYNTWKDIDGTGFVLLPNSDGWKFYGNIFLLSASYPLAGQTGNIDNGTITNHTGGSIAGPTTNTLVYNNTFVDLSGTNQVKAVLFHYAGSSGTVYNNMFYGSTTMTFGGYTTHDYNWFYNTGAQSEPNMQTGTGNPFVNSAIHNFRISNGTNSGVALSSPYNVDLDNNTRASIDGVWDRGAFEYTGVADVIAPTAPPTVNVN